MDLTILNKKWGLEILYTFFKLKIVRKVDIHKNINTMNKGINDKAVERILKEYTGKKDEKLFIYDVRNKTYTLNKASDLYSDELEQSLEVLMKFKYKIKEEESYDIVKKYYKFRLYDDIKCLKYNLNNSLFSTRLINFKDDINHDKSIFFDYSWYGISTEMSKNYIDRFIHRDKKNKPRSFVKEKFFDSEGNSIHLQENLIPVDKLYSKSDIKVNTLDIGVVIKNIMVYMYRRKMNLIKEIFLEQLDIELKRKENEDINEYFKGYEDIWLSFIQLNYNPSKSSINKDLFRKKLSTVSNQNLKEKLMEITTDGKRKKITKLIFTIFKFLESNDYQQTPISLICHYPEPYFKKSFTKNLKIMKKEIKNNIHTKN